MIRGPFSTQRTAVAPRLQRRSVLARLLAARLAHLRIRSDEVRQRAPVAHRASMPSAAVRFNERPELRRTRHRRPNLRRGSGEGEERELRSGASEPLSATSVSA